MNQKFESIETSDPSERSETPLLPTSRGSAGVFNRVRDSIIRGDYQFNERLPSERELANQYGAARGTIRSALLQLEEANLVRRKFGSGTFVSYNSQFERDDIAEETSPLELIETRLAIEPHIVRLVVTNANNRELRKLEETLEQLLECGDDPNLFSSADESFHLMLAHCSQNPLLIWMYQRINDIRSHTQWSARKNNILVPEKITFYNEQHSELVRMIVKRDIEGAPALMVHHLTQARQDLLGSY